MHLLSVFSLRNRALISTRRHVQLAQKYGCPTVILRGCAVEDPTLVAEAQQVSKVAPKKALSDDEDEFEAFSERVASFVAKVQKKGQSQLEHFCRSIHTLKSEFPDVRLAVEPGATYVDLLNLEAMGWVLDDLAKQGLGYWHDTGRVHLRLPPAVGAKLRALAQYRGLELDAAILVAIAEDYTRLAAALRAEGLDVSAHEPREPARCR